MTATEQNDPRMNTPPPVVDMLTDGGGHVNRELATRIWTWEQQNRANAQSPDDPGDPELYPKLDYSVRSGLRLVDDLVQELLPQQQQQQQQQPPADGSSSRTLQADLVQEGLTALLDAMRHYREGEPEAPSSSGSNTADSNSSADTTTTSRFEAYARHQIRLHLEHILQEDRQPIRLPRSVTDVLQQAKQVSRRLAARGGARPSLAAVAEELALPLAQLQEYVRLQKRSRRTLSMENTVEISRTSWEEGAPAYRDLQDWEISQHLLLDDGHPTGHGVPSEERPLIDEFLDEMVEAEGDDQAWIHEQENAGPLTDVIPDTAEPSPDDAILADLIRQDMRDFLESTLDGQENQVVRLVFGLDTGRQLSLARTAQALDLEKDQVSLLLAGSLEKLRASYTVRFVEPYLDDENMVDSV
jgi:DNA-directed RNA polymerase specialized sigma subunit